MAVYRLYIDLYGCIWPERGSHFGAFFDFLGRSTTPLRCWLEMVRSSSAQRGAVAGEPSGSARSGAQNAYWNVRKGRASERQRGLRIRTEYVMPRDWSVRMAARLTHTYGVRDAARLKCTKATRIAELITS